MEETLAIAAILLFLGRKIKAKSNLLQRFFIPAPVVSALIFCIVVFIGNRTNIFLLEFDLTLQNFLMIAFFTTVGFLASFKLLAQGGVGVILFLIVATGLLTFQNVIGVALAKLFGMHPLFGLVVGSIPLTGGHGTAGSFGTSLETLGVIGAKTAGLAAATFGLVMGCLVGGPVAGKLMKSYKIKGVDNKKEDPDVKKEKSEITGDKILNAVIIIAIAMGLGSFIPPYVKAHTVWLVKGGLSLPAYIGPMLVAALIRNIMDVFGSHMPMKEIDVIGEVSLSLFLSMALMTMKLWELIDLAIPMIVILLVQTTFVILYTYFITYNVMKLIVSKYDSAVIVSGHCGFGMGATPTAIANMESFTSVNGFSTSAFFIVPLVGALFVDFTNAAVLTFFINIFG
jgi:ESS family glutamate:Na+ symporter